MIAPILTTCRNGQRGLHRNASVLPRRWRNLRESCLEQRGIADLYLWEAKQHRSGSTAPPWHPCFQSERQPKEGRKALPRDPRFAMFLLQAIEKFVQTRANSCMTPLWRCRKRGWAAHIVHGSCRGRAEARRGGAAKLRRDRSGGFFEGQRSQGHGGAGVAAGVRGARDPENVAPCRAMSRGRGGCALGSLVGTRTTMLQMCHGNGAVRGGGRSIRVGEVGDTGEVVSGWSESADWGMTGGLWAGARSVRDWADMGRGVMFASAVDWHAKEALHSLRGGAG
jgi:hypothetical protein